jgi:3-oxoacyl-[acyl-carrier-protein] synthase-3
MAVLRRNDSTPSSIKTIVLLRARIHSIDYHLPTQVLTNSEIVAQFPGRTAEDIERKLGIRERRVVGEDQCASDLGVLAVEKLFARGVCHPQQIDYLIFCTQSPDYLLPTTACMVSQRLGLKHSCGAIDVNLGCSGYVYGLGLAKGLIESGQARCVLLIAADTYTRYLHPADRSTRAIFGDAGSATLIDCVEAEKELLGPFEYGTDGEGAHHLRVETGGCRNRFHTEACSPFLFMDGREVFNFAAQVVPRSLEEYLRQNNLAICDIDLFVFHQANLFMLEHLRNKCCIPMEKFVVSLADTGNTVSVTIPIALRDSQIRNRINPGDKVLLLGFGVGFSWAIAMIVWPGLHNTMHS